MKKILSFANVLLGIVLLFSFSPKVEASSLIETETFEVNGVTLTKSEDVSFYDAEGNPVTKEELGILFVGGSDEKPTNAKNNLLQQRFSQFRRGATTFDNTHLVNGGFSFNSPHQISFDRLTRNNGLELRIRDHSNTLVGTVRFPSTGHMWQSVTFANRTAPRRFQFVSTQREQVRFAEIIVWYNW